MVPVLILAAGESRRMRGSDKLLQEVYSMPLLRRQVLMAQAVGQPVFVALPACDHPRAATISDLNVTILAVPESTQGMSATMRGAVAQLPDTKAFMILLADLVAITSADLHMVLDAQHRHPEHLIWRGATTDGKPGHPIIFDAALRPDFATLTGDQGGEPIVRAHLAETCLVPLPDQSARLDLDTPEDWAAWRKTTL
ncbi:MULTISPECIES: nucleotidyltransferase family protein [unclassified Yoonia]|uniref:nucleotidyltransferase family protein n=1 Tax=unclassified Yoonia TaxID=2629118 RepID=UPI002AFE6A32|nr:MULTISPECIES: nucleotidyltransferase family protein [unclassified Yoonia]